MKNRYLKNEKLSVVLFFTVAILYAIIYMTKNCYSAAMARLVEEGALTKSQTGTISAVFYIVYAPFQIIGGFAADKYSPYKLVLIGFVGAMIANALIVISDNYYFMLIVWALNGIIQFGVWPGVFKIVSSSLSPAHRRNAIFYIMFSSTTGLIMSYILAGLVSSWQMNFIVSSIALLLASAYWLIAGKYFDSKMVDNEIKAEEKKEEKQEENKVSFFKLLMTSGLIFALPVIVLQSVFSNGIQAMAPSMLAESYKDVSVSMASFLTIVPIVFNVLGKLSAKVIYKRKMYNEFAAMALCLSAVIPLFLGMLFVGKINVWIMLILISLAVLVSATSAIIPFSYMCARFFKSGKSATVSGLINGMASFGIVVANYVSPRVADMFNNNWVPVILVWIGFAVVSIMISALGIFPWKKFIKDK